MQQRKFIRLAAVLGAAAVGIGAFGAHGLKSLVGPGELITFGTGVRYHFYHTFAVFGAALLLSRPEFSGSWLARACWCWIVGILLFSGSLYLLTLSDYHGIPTGLLGPITPLGGLVFILGWGCLFFSARGERG